MGWEQTTAKITDKHCVKKHVIIMTNNYGKVVCIVILVECDLQER